MGSADGARGHAAERNRQRPERDEEGERQHARPAVRALEVPRLEHSLGEHSVQRGGHHPEGVEQVAHR